MYNFGETNDTICEQLVTMKKDGKYYAKFFGVWALAFVLVWLLVLVWFVNPSWMGFLILLAFGVFYGAIKISTMFYTEYEYIVVNKDLDIDKISGKAKRKRLITVKLPDVELLGVYDETAKKSLESRQFNEVHDCAEAGEDTYYMAVKHAKRGNVLVIASFNEKLLAAVKHSVPRVSQKF